MTTPFDFENKHLSAADFDKHELQFGQTIAELFTCQDVHFIHLSADGRVAVRPQRYDHDRMRSHAKETANQEAYPETLKAGADMAVQQRQPIIDLKRNRAFLPIADHDKIMVIIVITGGSPTLYTNTPIWFTLRSRQAERELRLIKQWSNDPTSGLLNSNHLHQELKLTSRFITESNPDEPKPHLLLIEVFPRVQDAGQSLANIRQTGFYLGSLFGDSAPLHQLGSGIFGLIWPKADKQEIQKLGYAILRKLKRHNAAKAHIGFAPILATQEPLAEAWQALNTARQRGVFALCQATALNPLNQQLPPTLPAVLASFKKKWRSENQFAVILLQRDLDTSEDFPARLISLIGENAEIIWAKQGRELFIYLPRVDQREALEKADSLRKKIKNLACGTYSQGIANYPCPGFKKTDIPLNARKALLHASFYGQAALTAFDSVSLNISGDIYYNDGDLNSAIREYRLGLNLDPQNINLLNSLGVIYAQIERYKMAIPLFERILAITPNDFMAMYNLGFAYLRGGDQKQAIKYFEQAIAVDDNSFDLLLQLGQIYCSDGQYKKAVKILSKAEKSVSSPKSTKANQPWEHCEPWNESGNGLGHDIIYRYLGEAYKGINKSQEAITYLQRAVRYNNRDARALSLLGELYAIEKQGTDIAVSLCRQAVELDGKIAGHWRRLAFTLLKDNNPETALEAAIKSLAITPKAPDCLLMLAQIYKKLGKLSQARTSLERILKLDGTNRTASKLLKQINRK
jgi:tetratricopeptide (TPR) repeat protein